jgi:hypothetical protein
VRSTPVFTLVLGICLGLCLGLAVSGERPSRRPPPPEQPAGSPAWATVVVPSGSMPAGTSLATTTDDPEKFSSHAARDEALVRVSVPDGEKVHVVYLILPATAP